MLTAVRLAAALEGRQHGERVVSVLEGRRVPELSVTSTVHLRVAFLRLLLLSCFLNLDQWHELVAACPLQHVDLRLLRSIILR